MNHAPARRRNANTSAVVYKNRIDAKDSRVRLYWLNMFNWKIAALCMGVAIFTGCGISTEGSRYEMQHGVSDSGYPPPGSGTNPGSPAISSMGEEVNEKGIEGEPVIAPKQNIPPNLAATPRT